MSAFTSLAVRGAKAPTRWRVERIEHPELPVWLAVADDEGGELLLGVTLGAIDSLEAHARRQGATLVHAQPGERAQPCSRASEQLHEYLAGTRREFELRLFGFGSEFEQQAWTALLEIPFGETRSYGEQARMLASPTPGLGGSGSGRARVKTSSARAVGRANGRNNLPIVVPCHRVIGSDGSLTGFAGGLSLKRWLLTHERAHERSALPSREAAISSLSRSGEHLIPHEQLALF